MVGDFLRFLKSECLEWHRSFLAAIPGEIGCKVRNGLYGYHAERGCRVLRGVTIYFPERLKLGRNVGISPYSQFNAAGGIEIRRHADRSRMHLLVRQSPIPGCERPDTFARL